MTNDTYETIGQFIKGRRELMGLTQSALGEKIGSSPATISLYESGDRKPEVEVLRKLAVALDVSVAALINTEVKDSDIDAALRSHDLTANDIDQVKNYIKFLKYERNLKKQDK